MPVTDLRSEHRELQVLEMISDGDRAVTQRTIANRLGIALGLSNLYVKRLVRKGYIKCVNVQANRIHYLITPKGIGEKARLTYAFINYSLDLYGQARQHLRMALKESGTTPSSRVAILGTGEAAELTYLTLKEQGLEPVAIFTVDALKPFLGLSVVPLADHKTIEFDALIVATLEPPERMVRQLVADGIPRERLLLLRPDTSDSDETAAATPGTEPLHRR
jgi:DNA-binding MarR family transcriptional regulator